MAASRALLFYPNSHDAAGPSHANRETIKGSTNPSKPSGKVEIKLPDPLEVQDDCGRK